MNTKTFDVVVDGVPYEIKATPFTFNNEQRFKVSYNNSNEEYIFTRDAEVGQLTAIDSDALDIPDNLEQAIAEKLDGLTI